jgi:hypothetical protein
MMRYRLAINQIRAVIADCSQIHTPPGAFARVGTFARSADQ